MEKIKNINMEDGKFKSSLKNIFKGSVISIFLTIILLFVLSLVLTYTRLSENMMSPIIYVICGISILIGSILSSIHISKNGIINGALVGFIYLIIMYILSCMFLSSYNLSSGTLIMLGICTLTGIIGGVIGVNIKNK